MPRPSSFDPHRRYGRLEPLEIIRINKYGCKIWLCACECGNKTEVFQGDLVMGKVVSCGCFRKEKARKRGKEIIETIRPGAIRRNTSHGGRYERLYEIWHGMKNRCENPKAQAWKNYGGRGIQVCQQWKEYPAFREWALNNGYDPEAPRGQCTLDRINVDGNYEPSNCRWADMKLQANNKRNSRKTMEV